MAADPGSSGPLAAGEFRRGTAARPGALVAPERSRRNGRPVLLFPAVDPDRDLEDRRDAFESALGSEYFALHGVRSGTTNESSTRASLFFTTLTGTLLALGFLAGRDETSGAAEAVAYAAVPIVALLGFLTFLRLVELAVLDVRALQEIRRIRGYWSRLHPDAAAFFPRPVAGQAIDVLLDTGERSGLFRATLTIAATVGVMDSLWIGAGTAFAAFDVGLPTGAAVAVGVVVGVVLSIAMFRHQTRRFTDVLGRAGD
jgi:hypothetical protein